MLRYPSKWVSKTKPTWGITLANVVSLPQPGVPVAGQVASNHLAFSQEGDEDGDGDGCNQDGHQELPVLADEFAWLAQRVCVREKVEKRKSQLYSNRSNCCYHFQETRCIKLAASLLDATCVFIPPTMQSIQMFRLSSCFKPGETNNGGPFHCGLGDDSLWWLSSIQEGSHQQQLHLFHSCVCHSISQLFLSY